MHASDAQRLTGELRAIADRVDAGRLDATPLIRLLREAAVVAIPDGLNGRWLVQRHAASVLQLTVTTSAVDALDAWDRHPDRTRQERARALRDTAARIAAATATRSPR